MNLPKYNVNSIKTSTYITCLDYETDLDVVIQEMDKKQLPPAKVICITYMLHTYLNVYL